MIILKEISKNYKKKQALTNVSFQIKENEIVGLIGPNGAGKSTILRIISEVNYASSGQMIKNEMISVGAVFDYNALYSQMSAFENLLFYYRLNKKPEKHDERVVCDALEKLNLLNERDNKVKTFSKGMCRKLAIARAIIMNPNVLLLDEPFYGLDVQSHAYIVNYLKEWAKMSGHAIIFSSHNMLEVENICTNIIILDKGKIKLDASLKELKARQTERRKIVLSRHFPEKLVEKALDSIGIQTYEYAENEILFNDVSIDGNKIWSEFTNMQVEIKELLLVYESLEDIYIREIKQDEEFN